MTSSMRDRRGSRASSVPKREALELIADKYRLERCLGAGGAGEVWLAHNVVLDVPVAVKLLHVHERGESKLAQRMSCEARATARLNHPAIVKVLDFGATPSGDPFLVMELLVGESLAELLQKQQRLPATEAVQLALPIADALDAAHSVGIVHRDIKPENVFIATNGARVQPKLLDFGIARMMKVDRRLTIDGALIGTPEYMSPEQARGRGDVDFRSDIWSYSVLLYELVCGELPFRGDNYHAVLDAVIHDEPPPLSTYDVGDEQLWRLISRGLAKDPAQRWSSMRELGAALARWACDRAVTEDMSGASLRATWSLRDSDPRISTLPLTESIPVTTRRRPRSLRPALVASSLAALAIALALIASLAGGAEALEAGPGESRVFLAQAPKRVLARPLAPPPPAPSEASEARPNKPVPRAPKPLASPASKYDFGF